MLGWGAYFAKIKLILVTKGAFLDSMHRMNFIPRPFQGHFATGAEGNRRWGCFGEGGFAFGGIPRLTSEAGSGPGSVPYPTSAKGIEIKFLTGIPKGCRAGVKWR